MNWMPFLSYKLKQNILHTSQIFVKLLQLFLKQKNTKKTLMEVQQKDLGSHSSNNQIHRQMMSQTHRQFESVGGTANNYKLEGRRRSIGTSSPRVFKYSFSRGQREKSQFYQKSQSRNQRNKQNNDLISESPDLQQCLVRKQRSRDTQKNQITNIFQNIQILKMDDYMNTENPLQRTQTPKSKGCKSAGMGKEGKYSKDRQQVTQQKRENDGDGQVTTAEVIGGKDDGYQLQIQTRGASVGGSCQSKLSNEISINEQIDKQLLKHSMNFQKEVKKAACDIQTGPTENTNNISNLGLNKLQKSKSYDKIPVQTCEKIRTQNVKEIPEIAESQEYSSAGAVKRNDRLLNNEEMKEMNDISLQKFEVTDDKVCQVISQSRVSSLRNRSQIVINENSEAGNNDTAMFIDPNDAKVAKPRLIIKANSQLILSPEIKKTKANSRETKEQVSNEGQGGGDSRFTMSSPSMNQVCPQSNLSPMILSNGVGIVENTQNQDPQQANKVTRQKSVKFDDNKDDSDQKQDNKDTLKLNLKKEIKKQQALKEVEKSELEVSQASPSAELKKVPEDRQQEDLNQIRKSLKQFRYRNVQRFIDLNINVGIVWLLAQLYQFVFFDSGIVASDKSLVGPVVLPIYLIMAKNFNTSLQNLFLTMIFLGINALIKFLLHEEEQYRSLKQRMANQEIKQIQKNYEFHKYQNKQRQQDFRDLRKRDGTGSKGSASSKKQKDLNSHLRQRDSTLKKHFNLIMMSLYVIYTICAVENIVKNLNILTIQIRILLIVGSVQLLQQNQNRIMEFVDFNLFEKNQKTSQFYICQSQIKLIIYMFSQAYLHLRLLSIYDIDVGYYYDMMVTENQKFKELTHDLVETKSHYLQAVESLGLLNCFTVLNMNSFFIIIAIQFFYHWNRNEYLELKYDFAVKKLVETSHFEKICQNTLSNISDGIVLFNLQQKVISINERVRLMMGFDESNGSNVGQRANKEAKQTDWKGQGITMGSDSFSFCTHFQNDLVTLPRVKRPDTVDLSQVYVWKKCLDPKTCLTIKQPSSEMSPKNSDHKQQRNSQKFNEFDQSKGEKMYSKSSNSSGKNDEANNHDEKPQYRLLEVLEDLAEQIKDPRYKQDITECYKLVQNKRFLRISIDQHKIRGITYFMFTIKDITMERKYHKGLESKKQDMLQLAFIVHELKTPLNCIQQAGNMLKNFTQNDCAEVPQLQKNFDFCIEFLYQIIDGILDLAKVNNNQNLTIINEFFNIRNFLNDIMAIFEDQCRTKNVELKKDVHDSLPEMIYTDPKRIKQILMNLLSNAEKFTSKGYIKIKLGLEDLMAPSEMQQTGNESQYQSKMHRRGSVCDQKQALKNIYPYNRIKKKLNIEVEDTGIGIKTQDVQKLFKYFGKLEDSSKINKKGTGLGLNIIRRIIQQMGGDINIESEYGKGTKFIMSLIVQVKNEEAKADKSKQQSPNTMHNDYLQLHMDDYIFNKKSRKLGNNCQQSNMAKLKSLNASMFAMQSNLISGGLLSSQSFYQMMNPINKTVINNNMKSTDLNSLDEMDYRDNDRSQNNTNKSDVNKAQSQSPLNQNQQKEQVSASQVISPCIKRVKNLRYQKMPSYICNISSIGDIGDQDVNTNENVKTLNQLQTHLNQIESWNRTINSSRNLFNDNKKQSVLNFDSILEIEKSQEESRNGIKIQSLQTQPAVNNCEKVQTVHVERQLLTKRQTQQLTKNYDKQILEKPSNPKDLKIRQNSIKCYNKTPMRSSRSRDLQPMSQYKNMLQMRRRSCTGSMAFGKLNVNLIKQLQLSSGKQQTNQIRGLAKKDSSPQDDGQQKRLRQSSSVEQNERDKRSKIANKQKQ